MPRMRRFLSCGKPQDASCGEAALHRVPALTDEALLRNMKQLHFGLSRHSLRRRRMRYEALAPRVRLSRQQPFPCFFTHLYGLLFQIHNGLFKDLAIVLCFPFGQVTGFVQKIFLTSVFNVPISRICFSAMSVNGILQILAWLVSEST